MPNTNLTTHPHRCACIKADGKQCTRRAWTTTPNVMAGDGHAYTYGRDVPMCVQHNRMFWRKRDKSPLWRLPLIENGFVGCYNKFGFGSIVTAEQYVDWDTVERLTVPKYWAHDVAT